MRILCDQMVKAEYVETLAAEPQHTVIRVRDELQADASDDRIVGYATEHEWVLLTADDDFFDETIPHGLLYYEDENPPSPRALRDAHCQSVLYNSHSLTLWKGAVIPSETSNPASARSG
jgi:hypothetical protein